MKFNLKTYLTEKLASNTIIKDLLNDPGGFFKFYKSRYYDLYDKRQDKNHLWDRAYELNRELIGIIDKLYHKDYYDKKYESNRDILINGKNVVLTDELKKKAYTAYMKKFNTFMRICKLLFTKPSTEVLNIVLNNKGLSFYHTADDAKKYAAKLNLANVTDDMFTKYTYQDIKNDKTLYNDILKTNKTILWMLEDNTLDAVQLQGDILLISPKLYLMKGKDVKLSQRQIRELMNGETDLYIKDEIVDTLSDGTVLKWPILSTSYNSIINGINASLCLLKLDKERFDLPFSPGKFLSKASKLLKFTNWGASPNDYILIFSPHTHFKDSSWDYSYNLGTDNFIQHKNDVENYVTDRFHWVYDIFGQVYPYGGTKSEKSEQLYKFMSKLYDGKIKSAYELDKYNVKMLSTNLSNYDALKTMMQSYRKIDKDLKIKFNLILQILLNYIQIGLQFIPKVKENTKLDYNLLQKSLLFSAYQFALNDMIKSCTNISTKLDHIVTLRNDITKNIKDRNRNNYNMDYSASLLTQVSKDIETIILDIETKYIPALDNAKLKFEEFN